LTAEIDFCEANYPEMVDLAKKAQVRALSVFNWEMVADEHVKVFLNS